MKFDRRWVVGGLILVVVVLPLAIGAGKGDPARSMDLATIAEREIHPTILAPGTLAFRNEVNLTSQLTARVATIAIREGDLVEQGQVLMTLDPEIYRNAVDRERAVLRQGRITIERQRAEVALRKKQFERSEALLAEHLIDQGSFDEARNRFRVAQLALRSSEEDFHRAAAGLEDAQEQLGKTVIHSPIKGRVVALPIKVGETAVPSTSSFLGAQLAQIADTSVIQAELKVDEADIARVAIGQRADVYAAAYPDRALKGTVEQIALAPTIEGQARAYKVTAALAVPKGVDLRSGMSVRAEIALGDSTPRPAVPVEAVVTEVDDDKHAVHYLWLVEDGKAYKRKVDLGASDDAWQAIGKPFKAGDVVARGPSGDLRQLQEGDAVEARAVSESGSGSGAEDDDE